MSFDLTVEEAAALLEISRPRVYQLIEKGALQAEKVGGIWLVDRMSVDARLATEPKAGRPPRLEMQQSSGLRSYTLMNRTHEVLLFEYDETTARFLDAGTIIDATRAPLGLLSPRGSVASARALSYWWKHRAIPDTREGMKAKLAQLGLSAAYELPFKNLGLSLSDQYWIRPSNTSLAWEDVNYFHNEFPEMTTGTDWLREVGLNSPDNTSEGELPKKWICEKGERILVKGGSALNQEPYNEVVASALYRRLLAPQEYTPYWLAEHKGEAVSQCMNFVAPDEEYIPAYYVRQIARQKNHHSTYQHYLECCAKLGVSDAESALSKMIVCDDILGNFDRHWRNFGLIRKVETLEYRVAPLFDTGSSLWCNATLGRLRTRNFSFNTKPFYEDANRQLRLVNNYSWFKPDALTGFVQEAEGILQENEALHDRLDLICTALQERIDRILRIL